MTLKSKLTAIASLSIIVICFLGFRIIQTSYDNYNRVLSIEKIIDLTEEISALIHEVQLERGLSAAFLISGDEKFKIKLIKQKKEVSLKFHILSKSITKKTNFYDKEIIKSIDKILKNYQKDNKLKRLLIINESISVLESIDFFTSFNQKLSNILIKLSKKSTNSEITSQLIAFYNLLLLKDTMGLERAFGSILLIWNFADETIVRFNNSVFSQEIYKRSFFAYLSSSEKERYKNRFNNTALKYIDVLSKKLLDWNKKDSLDIDSLYWFESSSQKIDFFHEETQYFIKKLQKKVNIYEKKLKNELILLSIIMIFSILIFSIFTYMAQKRIMKSLSNFRFGLLSFFDYLNQKTEIVKVLDDSTSDEFGLMSKIVNENIVSTKKSLDEDKLILNEAILIIKEFDKGNLHQRLEKNVSNLVLNELKNILNQMANNLEYTIEELEQTNEEYEVSLENLKKTQRQLIESEKMASLGGLVAGVSHEINTPVGIGITGSTHFLKITKDLKQKYEKDDMDEEDFAEYLKTSSELASLININLSKAAELVKSFKQIAVDQSSEEKRTFILDEYLNEVFLSIQNIIKKTNLKIEITCEKNIRIFSYPGLLSQVITNLVINSIIHGYNKEKKGILSLDAKIENGELLLKFKDDGKGIPLENIHKIYEPFFTTNRENGGSGLGLNIIYNIITKQLKGTITCKSNEPIGTEFNIRFKV